MRVVSSLPIFVLALSLSTPLHAQQAAGCAPPDSLSGMAAVTGRVVEEESQVPMGFVQLRLSTLDGGQIREARSDPKGFFAFCAFPSGAAELTGQIGQLGGRVGPLVLHAGGTVSLTLSLAPPVAEGNSGTITGVVLQAGSRSPVEGATVLVPDLGQSSITNEFGHFTFPSLPPGEVHLKVTRLGYAPVTGTVRVEYERTVHTEITLSTEPIALDPIQVTAVRRRIVLPGLEDFERRYYSGWGEFVLEEDIQLRRPTKLTDMLYETGVDVLGDGDALWIRRSMCAPLVYIDDVKVTYLPRAGPFTRAADGRLKLPKKSVFKDPDADPKAEAADAVNNLVHPMDVVAIEVYKGPAETPGQYIDSNSKCGVILIWTRRGNIRRH